MFNLYTYTDALSTLENLKASFANKADVQTQIAVVQATVARALADALEGKNTKPEEFTNEELSMFENRQYKYNKIPLIKKVRERSGCGLREAKEAVEKYATDYGYAGTWAGGYAPTDYGYRESAQF